MYKKSVVLILAIIFFTLSIFNFVKKEVSFSALENRYLKTFPKISMKNLLNGTLTKDIESYSSDQFIFRNKWITANTNFKILLGQQDNGRVYFGEDGWLFSIDESFDNSKYEKNTESIQNFVLQYQDISKISFILVPSKLVIHDNYLPKFADTLDEEYLLNRFKENFDKDIIFYDLFEKFKQHSFENLYFKTDHHWTSLGAYYAYQTYLGANVLKKDEYTVETLSNNFKGTDYRKANNTLLRADEFDLMLHQTMNRKEIKNHDTDTMIPLFQEDYLNKVDQYAFYMGGNHGYLSLKGEGDHKEKLLIIKDSFSNSFIPFLIPHFDTIDIIDLRYFVGDLDEIIIENNYSEIMFNYNLQTFLQDNSVLKLQK